MSVLNKFKKWFDPSSEPRKTQELIIEWVDIPAGTFIMGSPSSEVDRGTDETQHQVTLSAFKMSKHQITFEHYDLFCEATIKHIGLLRSLAVIDEFKNQKIGQKLIKHLFDYCTIEQIDQLSNPG
jgi:formylglycine-generating enzyme required for sulfatase activity